eukprot:TRINITY_DN6035_c0_g1_i7.p1 TRINITY_DN6035_c0_g1~~TRINITY_DN6035_c0_g1_i7.p1  ORF type:complete len:648 (+),score=72.82 TRINITY_DN6035_c0_g1_i7:75-2018(+)
MQQHLLSEATPELEHVNVRRRRQQFLFPATVSLLTAATLLLLFKNLNNRGNLSNSVEGFSAASPAATLLQTPAAPWWKTQVMYQIYPRSFQDSDGDGTGDLRGIIQRLPYLKSLGIGFIWLSPVMKSPMRDFGYDIEDFADIDPLFGSMEDMRELIRKAGELGIRILMDFVPNHTSNTSKWFIESRSSKTNPKRDWYIWHPGKILPDGSRAPPNNWASNFGGGLGSSWTWDEQTEEYYYHAFGEFQPDLNYRNPEVRQALYGVLRFWMSMGVAGYRIDAVPFLLEDPALPDEPVDMNCAKSNPIWNCMNHMYTQNNPENHGIIRGWRKVIDEFDERAMFGEIYADLQNVMTYYGTPDEPEFNIPFNFEVMGENYGLPAPLLDATAIRMSIRNYVNAVPKWCHGNWVLGNHDNHRLMDRVGNNSEMVAALYNYVNLVPGTPVIYNGDEIAMRDTYIPYEKCKDPMCIKNPKLFSLTGRDPERTPMQWDDSPQAGFSSNPNTWLPLNPNHGINNVAFQNRDPYSPLSRIKRVLAFRNANPEIALGHTQWLPHEENLPPNLRHKVVATQFSTHSSFGSDFALTVANWDPYNSVEVDIFSLVSPEIQTNPPAGWHIIFSSMPEPYSRDIPDHRHIILPPGAVNIIQPQRFY